MSDMDDISLLTPAQLAERRRNAVTAGIIGAMVAVATGRTHTRIDNMMIGGLFTGFAAYRDPRATLGGTLLVAAVEGAIWGVTDRVVPRIKDYVMPPPEMQKGLVPESVSYEPAVAGYY